LERLAGIPRSGRTIGPKPRQDQHVIFHEECSRAPASSSNLLPACHRRGPPFKQKFASGLFEQVLGSGSLLWSPLLFRRVGDLAPPIAATDCPCYQPHG
jgi:hypothetical protein